MFVEQNFLFSFLKLTKEGLVTPEEVAKSAKLPGSVVSELLEKLDFEKLAFFDGEFVGASSESRLALAVRAVDLGVDLERVGDCLRWQEFEDMAALALERNGFSSLKNVRFKHVSKRWEIDVVGCKKPLVLCIDCKHWKRGIRYAALKKIVELQVARAKAFADSLPVKNLNVDCTLWKQAKFVPVIVSLVQYGPQYFDAVPIVPILRLQDFIHQLPAYVESLQYFSREFAHLR